MSVSRGTRTDAVSLARRALARPTRRRTDPSVVIFALKALASCDELEEACTGWSNFIELARTRGRQDMVAFACIFRAEANLWAGSLADAEADALEATEAFTRSGHRALEPVSMLVQVQLERDRLRRGREVAGKSHTAGPSSLVGCSSSPLSPVPA